MKKFLVGAVAGLAALAGEADPSLVGPVLAEQNPETLAIDIRYEIEGGPAIVTLDSIETNGVPVEAADFRDDLFGAINCKVPSGVKRAAWVPNVRTWADRSLSGVDISARISVWSVTVPPDYLVVDLAATNYLPTLAYYSSTNVVPGGLASDRYRTTKMLMRRIPAKDVVWRMGSNATEPYRDKLPGTDRSGIEIPHYVKLTADYYMAVFPMTIGQRLTALNDKSGFRVPTCLDTVPDALLLPDNNLAYNNLRGGKSDGIDWPVSEPLHGVKSGCVIDCLRKRTGLEGLDLPTEAQWEFACRAGAGTGLYDGHDISTWDGTCPYLIKLGWTYANTTNGYSTTTATTQYRMPMPVGKLEPNAWGLYDMLGNVQEWCLDWYSTGDDYFATFGAGYETGDVVVDPLGPKSTVQTSVSERTLRSSGPTQAANSARIACRQHRTPGDYNGNTGFRLVCPVDGL